MTYKGAGVNYASIDGYKHAAQAAGKETEGALIRFEGLKPISGSREGSVFLTYMPSTVSPPLRPILGGLVETLGTKSIVAEKMYEQTGELHFDKIAEDAVAMIVNDAATAGIVTLVIHQLLEVGSSDWFKDTARYMNLIEGWKRACKEVGCVWGGGETPVLPDLLFPNAISLSGAATSGMSVAPDSWRMSEGELIRVGDVILFLHASGIHANGLSLARAIAEKIPNGYLTPVLGDERPYGEVLLDPTPLYSAGVEECFKKGVDIHYIANITGHGLRKLMRAKQPFTYVVEKLPPLLPIFEFMMERGPVDEKEAYNTFNMGVGYALIVHPNHASPAQKILSERGFDSYIVGHVKSSKDGKKRVEMPSHLKLPPWEATIE